MFNNSSKFNAIQFPSTIVKAAAQDAALDACAAFTNARIELAMPQSKRTRGDRAVHADVLSRMRLAERLSTAGAR